MCKFLALIPSAFRPAWTPVQFWEWTKNGELVRDYILPLDPPVGGQAPKLRQQCGTVMQWRLSDDVKGGCTMLGMFFLVSVCHVEYTLYVLVECLCWNLELLGLLASLCSMGGGVWFGEQPLPPFFFLLTPSFSVYVHSFSMT